MKKMNLLLSLTLFIFIFTACKKEDNIVSNGSLVKEKSLKTEKSVNSGNKESGNNELTDRDGGKDICNCKYRILSFTKNQPSGYPNYYVNFATNAWCGSCPYFGVFMSDINNNCNNYPGGTCNSNLINPTFPTAFYPFNCTPTLFSSFGVGSQAKAHDGFCNLTDLDKWTMVYEIQCVKAINGCPNAKSSTGPITVSGMGPINTISKWINLGGCGCDPIVQ